MSRPRFDASCVFLVLMAVALLLPLIATFLNSIASEWSGTALPAGWTGRYYADIFADERFRAAVLRSVAVSTAALALATLIMVPAVIAAHVYWPALDRWMARLVILPYAVPGIILMVGYLRIFSGPPLQIGGTPLVLVLTYVPACFPMFYISLKNSLRGLDTADLIDAGRLLGVGDLAILWRVILPCVLPSAALAIVLNFAGLIAEFVYAKMLVGGDFETLQMYMFAQRSLSGRISSVIVILYFLIVLAITLTAFRLVRETERRS